jgi:hypothetical protein
MRRATRIRSALVLVGCLVMALTAVASASTDVRKSAARTFTLRPGATGSFSVAYPDALEFSGARYSGSVTIIVPRGASASAPRARNVHILSRGPSQGGSLFTVRVRNGNPAGTTSVRVRVTATTLT